MCFHANSIRRQNKPWSRSTVLSTVVFGPDCNLIFNDSKVRSRGFMHWLILNSGTFAAGLIQPIRGLGEAV